MPEGDTIFRAAGRLRSALEGRVITACRARVAQVRSLGPERLVGQTVTAVESWGKHLLIWFGPSGLCLHTHMRMNGSWHLYEAGRPWRRPAARASLVLESGDVAAVCFAAGVCELLTADQVARHSSLGSLGPDLLDPEPDTRKAAERILAQEDRPIAEVLLDQRVVAGIGNVYKSELLFIHGVDPWAPVSAVDRELVRAMVDTAIRLLRRNATLASPKRSTTGGSPGTVHVYGRARRACPRCGTPIRVDRQGAQARSTYWCPRCQR